MAGERPTWLLWGLPLAMFVAGAATLSGRMSVVREALGVVALLGLGGTVAALSGLLGQGRGALAGLLRLLAVALVIGAIGLLVGEGGALIVASVAGGLVLLARLARGSLRIPPSVLRWILGFAMAGVAWIGSWIAAELGPWGMAAAGALAAALAWAAILVFFVDHDIGVDETSHGILVTPYFVVPLRPVRIPATAFEAVSLDVYVPRPDAERGYRVELQRTSGLPLPMEMLPDYTEALARAQRLASQLAIPLEDGTPSSIREAGGSGAAVQPSNALLYWKSRQPARGVPRGDERADWASSQIEASRPRLLEVVAVWPFVGVWIYATSIGAGSLQARADDPFVLAVFGIFAVVDVALVVVALFVTLRFARFTSLGRPRLVAQHLPVAPGDILRGAIAIPRELSPTGTVSVSLVCVRRAQSAESTVHRSRGRMRGARRSQETLWRHDESSRLEGRMIAVALPVPEDAPVTTAVGPADRGILWRVEVRVPLRGPDFAAEYEFPVVSRPHDTAIAPGPARSL